MPIDQIVVPKRVRRDLGDLGSLMESMRAHGLMNPVVVNKDRILIAGHRRLESAKRLGWHSVDVYVVDKYNELERLEMEVDENVQRKALTGEELSEAYARIDRLRNPGILARILRAILAFFRWLFGSSRRE